MKPGSIHVGVSVVLYRPAPENLKHLASLFSALDPGIFSVAAFLNSEAVGGIPGAKTLHHDGRNIGLGAHNITAAHLVEEGCSILITLDQDTAISPAQLHALGEHLQRYPRTTIVGPHLIQNPQRGEPEARTAREFRGGIEPKRFLSTSGMTMFASRWIELGGYKADLFIGELDRELCLRNLAQGGSNVQINSIRVPHNAGQGRIGIGRVGIVKHQPTRYYYYIRNKTRLLRDGTYHARELVQLLAYASGVLVTLPINSDRTKVLTMVVKGVAHGLLGRGGPYPGV